MNSDPSRRRVLRIAGVTLAGGAVAGCSAAPGSDDDSADNDGDGNDATPTDAGDGGSENGGEQWVETSTVEMNDQLAFAPKRIRVSTGTTVTWENVGNVGHTVTAYEDSVPDGAAYFASGGFDSQSAASDGYSNGEGNVSGDGTYEHTFETTGTYEYYCIPHEMNGMVGFVEVV